MEKNILTFLVCIGALANAKDCKKHAETAAKGKCGKKVCQFKEVVLVTDLSGYVNSQKDEILFRISENPGRIFEVFVKKSSCKIVSVYEIGASDEEEEN